MPTFAERLAAARRAAGMTQEELANAVHVARSTVSSWEKGRTQPDLSTVQLLGQLLQCDFLSSEASSPNETEKTNRRLADDAPEAAADGTSTPPGHKPALRKRKTAVICAAVLAAVVIALLLPVLRNKPVIELKDADGAVYRIADFQRVTPSEMGKAYITIDTVTETVQGDNVTYWMYTFIMREDNGVDFHIDRLENIWLKTNGAHPFIFGESDLKSAGVGPDIPALQKVSFDGGMPKDQTNMIGVGLRIYGHDANGEELTFTAYIPFPQN